MSLWENPQALWEKTPVKKISFQWRAHFQTGINFVWEITDFLTDFNYQRTWTPLKHLSGLVSHSSMCPCSVHVSQRYSSVLKKQECWFWQRQFLLYLGDAQCTMEPARSGMPKLLRGSSGNVWLRTQSGWSWTPTSDRASSLFYVGGGPKIQMGNVPYQHSWGGCVELW